MSGTYITRDGDRLDQIMTSVFGTIDLDTLIEYNPRITKKLVGVSEHPAILSAGLTITLPPSSELSTPPPAITRVRLWD